MSFLAPAFLLGAAAIALPLIFHLVRRTPRDRRPFSSLMFLWETPPRLTRRSRLEHWLLLALRCAVVGLLAFAFARPFWKTARPPVPEAVEARRLLLLVDTSASMRRPGLWSEARSRVEAVLGEVTPADEVAVMTFDRDVRSLLGFAEWTAGPAGDRVALARSRLADVSPGWSGTQLGHALIRAAEALADVRVEPAPSLGQIVLVSDLPEGSYLEPLQGYEWPKGIDVRIEPLRARPAGNAAVQRVADPEDGPAQAGPEVRIRISNAADSEAQQFRLGWSEPEGHGFAQPPREVYVPPGRSQLVALPVPPGLTGLDRVRLEGDAQDFDNTLFVVPPEPARLEVLYLGQESEQDAKQPLYFLRRAFRDTRRQAISVRAGRPDQPPLETAAQGAALCVLSGAASDPVIRLLRQQVESGQTLLFVLRDADSGPTLARLLGRDGLPVSEAPTDRYALLAEIDFRHPCFAPFADPRFSDFTRIHFWRHRRLDPAAIPGARVVAGFDDGAPALLEVPVERGRILILTSGWHPEDSQLALSTKFVPWLYTLIDGAESAAATPASCAVGDALPLPASSGTTARILRGPDGSEDAVPAGSTNFAGTTRPGIYTLVSGGTSRRFAVNLDSFESRTSPLPLDILERLGAPMAGRRPDAAREAARRVRLENAELESRQKLWRWSLVGVLVLLLAETGLAGRTARRALIPGGAVP